MSCVIWNSIKLYRVVHLLVNLGWVDFDLGCSIILPSCSASSANFQAEPGRGWNSQNQSQPNPGSPGEGPPCTLVCHEKTLVCAGRLIVGRISDGDASADVRRGARHLADDQHAAPALHRAAEGGQQRATKCLKKEHS